MDLPQPRDLTARPIGKQPLSKREQKEVARNEHLLELQERTRVLVTKLRLAGYSHVEEVARQLSTEHLNRLAAEYAKTDNPALKRYLEDAMERFMAQITAILREHNA